MRGRGKKLWTFLMHSGGHSSVPNAFAQRFSKQTIPIKVFLAPLGVEGPFEYRTYEHVVV